jgi:hypothetical protein
MNPLRRLFPLVLVDGVATSDASGMRSGDGAAG